MYYISNNIDIEYSHHIFLCEIYSESMRNVFDADNSEQNVVHDEYQDSTGNLFQVNQSTRNLFNVGSSDNIPTAKEIFNKISKRERRSTVGTFDGSDSEEMPSESESEDEDDRPLYQKIIINILKGPTLIVELLNYITIPTVDNKSYKPYITCISCITSPILIMYAFGLTSINVLGNVPLYAIVEGVGVILSIVTFVTIKQKQQGLMLDIKQERLLDNTATHMIDTLQESLFAGADDNISESGMSVSLSVDTHKAKKLYNNEEQSLRSINEDSKLPKESNATSSMNGDIKYKTKKLISKQPVFKIFFLFLGFLSAISWIELVANELVNLLTTLGVISTIDLAILGLTVLAWANSTGDMIADVSVSRRGYAKMGISAAIGGPTLNVYVILNVYIIIVIIWCIYLICKD